MEQLDSFREALSLLRDLADLQNGPPLEQHREEFYETMDKVYGFLATHEEDVVFPVVKTFEQEVAEFEAVFEKYIDYLCTWCFMPGLGFKPISLEAYKEILNNPGLNVIVPPITPDYIIQLYRHTGSLLSKF